MFDRQPVLYCKKIVHDSQLLISMYFVFSKTYPSVHASPLLFLQIYRFNISAPDTTCRSRDDKYKKGINVNQSIAED